MEKKHKILLIDDEQGILDVLSYMLRREGFDVDTASSGKEGLDKIMKGGFAGVVTDLSMPEMDGLTLLKLVRAHHSFMPFIFLSGHANPQDEHEMINYGAYELIVKPHLEKVADGIRTLIKSQKEIECLKEAGQDGIEFLDILHSADRKII